MTADDFNARNIAEFRANHGRLGGNFAGAPVLLLHTTGARSGQPRITPMMYLPDGDRYVVFASKAGADRNPDWYHNLTSQPDVQIEVGDRTLDVHAREIHGAERDMLFERQAALYPGFASYQEKTTRTIPVIALTARTRVLFVGQEPETVDFSDPALPRGLDAATIRAGIAVGMEQMTDRGWHADLCLVRPDESATAALELQLSTHRYDCVVIGGGIRIPPGSLLLFEKLLNAVHRSAPTASIAFNTAPQDTAAAAARWLAAESVE